MRKAADIVLLNEERAQLLQLARSKTVSVRLARRAQIILGAADGLDNRTIAAQVGVGRVQVGRWRNRYIEGGLAAIQQDLPRGGRPVKADAAQIVRLTTQTLPANATQWSTRTMAAQVGVSDTTVLRVWRQHGLKPHRVRGFKVSRDPKFVEKLEDIVGLYMSPPEHALVLCCDCLLYTSSEIARAWAFSRRCSNSSRCCFTECGTESGSAAAGVPGRRL